jgi:hypothetical protein
MKLSVLRLIVRRYGWLFTPLKFKMNLAVITTRTMNSTAHMTKTFEKEFKFINIFYFDQRSTKKKIEIWTRWSCCLVVCCLLNFCGCWEQNQKPNQEKQHGLNPHLTLLYNSNSRGDSKSIWKREFCKRKWFEIDSHLIILRAPDCWRWPT